MHVLRACLERRLHETSENVLPLYAIWESEDALWMLMERADGSLLDLRTSFAQVPEDEFRVMALDFARQIAGGVLAMHSDPEVLVHRDIKPANVLLFSGDTLRVKVADFSLVRRQETCATHRAGTLRYLPPECFEAHRPEAGPDARGQDTWSVAVVVAELFLRFQRAPFSHLRPEERRMERDTAQFHDPYTPADLASLDTYARGLSDAVRGCLRRDWRARRSLREFKAALVRTKRPRTPPRRRRQPPGPTFGSCAAGWPRPVPPRVGLGGPRPGPGPSRLAGAGAPGAAPRDGSDPLDMMDISRALPAVAPRPPSARAAAAPPPPPPPQPVARAARVSAADCVLRPCGCKFSPDPHAPLSRGLFAGHSVVVAGKLPGTTLPLAKGFLVKKCGASATPSGVTGNTNVAVIAEPFSQNRNQVMQDLEGERHRGRVLIVCGKCFVDLMDADTRPGGGA
eukprot:tig00000630_g2726.t1